MRPRNFRLGWIVSWLKLCNDTCSGSEIRVDVLDTDFVKAYIYATNAPFVDMMIGAPRCRMLGRDLALLHKQGILKRHATGLSPGDASMGFPKWVYSYHLPRAVRDDQTTIR